jgi:4-hydroxythreonine-4-phosphate dehydrogenase
LPAAQEALPLALTMGEPLGIGGEIALSSWRRRQGLPPFFLLDDPARLAALARALDLEVPIVSIAKPSEAVSAFDRALPVLPLAREVRVLPGRTDGAAPAVIEALERGTDLALHGQIRALVTNPVHKSTFRELNLPYPGHTEFFAARSKSFVAMLLAAADLRTVPVTVHRGLAEAIASLTVAGIVATARLVQQALIRDFAVQKPRLAVAGLNPHAGEDGALGREDIEIIAPAVAELKRGGLDVRGPLAPDSMFHSEARTHYDVAICMYHDQALIPIKTLDFFGGVNVTLGLPFVRTSPDHGTALDIAGRGIARPDSLITALRLAAWLAANRAKAATNGGA